MKDPHERIWFEEVEALRHYAWLYPAEARLILDDPYEAPALRVLEDCRAALAPFDHQEVLAWG